MPSGFHCLSRILDRWYGEDKDTSVGEVLDTFFDLRRGRSSFVEYISEHEYAYEEAKTRGGLEMNEIGLSHLLMKGCGVPRDRLDHHTVHPLCSSPSMPESFDADAMLLDEVMSLSDALKRFRGGLELKVSPGDRSKLKELQETCARHPGQNPLFFQALGEDGLTRRVRASKERSVTISEELAGELCDLLGHDRVGIVRV